MSRVSRFAAFHGEENYSGQSDEKESDEEEGFEEEGSGEKESAGEEEEEEEGSRQEEVTRTGAGFRRRRRISLAVAAISQLAARRAD